jgi:hypothetical protein
MNTSPSHKQFYTTLNKIENCIQRNLFPTPQKMSQPHNNSTYTNPSNKTHSIQGEETNTILINISNNQSYNNLSRDPAKLEKIILQSIQSDDYNRLSITNSGDLLIFPVSNAKHEAILSNNSLFPGCQKITSTAFDKRPSVIIINFNADDYINNKAELKEQGIIDAAEVGTSVHSQSKRPKNLLKLICNSIETQLKLICGDIIINNKQYIIEPSFSILQCKNCHIFDHNERNCEAETKFCPNCADNDINHVNQLKCKRTPYCINCKSNHGAYFRGCCEFKSRKFDKIRQIKFNLQKKSTITTAQIAEWESKAKHSNESPFNLSNASSTNSLKSDKSDSELMKKLDQLTQKVDDLQINNIHTNLKEQNDIITKMLKSQENLSNNIIETRDELHKRINFNENTTIKMFEALADGLATDHTQSSMLKLQIHRIGAQSNWNFQSNFTYEALGVKKPSS